MDTLVTILLFLFVFCIIVVSHEFGHYIVAKLNGIRVIEFGIGMGPKLCGFKKGGTEYCIRLLPIGGACIYDMDEDELTGGDMASREAADMLRKAQVGELTGRVPKTEEGAESVNEAGRDDSFLNEKNGIAFTKAGVWRRIAVVLAGPIFNFILAYLLALIVVWNTGSTSPVINNVMEGYPAEEAGMQSGDIITEMNGSKVYLATEIYVNTYINKDKTMDIKFLRDGKEMEVSVTPKYNEEEGRYLVGFNGYGKYVTCKNSGVFRYAYYEVRYGFVGTVKSLLMMLAGDGSKDDVAGPVGMAQIIGETKDAAAPYGVWAVFLNMFNIAMLLSVNLGILNLLPLPAIDGGRLIFLVVEAIRGKPVPPEKESIVHLVGFALLLVLMVFVMYNDIMRLITA